MDALALVLAALLIIALAVSAAGRWSRLAWEVTVTLVLVLMLLKVTL